jgi:undecaprenyl diphosphate synthase
LSLFAFSTENWQRPKEEVWALMKMFERYLSSELQLLQDNGIRLRVIGNRARLSEGLLAAVQKAEQATKDNVGMDLILAVSYGGREELVHAAQHIAARVAAGDLDPAAVSAADIRAGLFAPEVPDPDLMIRTSDEFRISNFLLWQLAYTEIVVTPTYWPAFDKEQYHACIQEFGTRKRRYGLTGEQIVDQVLAS